MPRTLDVTLNARLRPLDRGDRYEDPLVEAFEEADIDCEPTGGGSLLSSDHEPTLCDFSVEVGCDAETAVSIAVAALEEAGAPKGSRLQVDEGDARGFGVTEGVAVYLNGTDLPPEVYAEGDVNVLVEELRSHLGQEGHLQSWWQGSRETALYFYGPSARRIQDLAGEVLPRFPLAERCRVVPLPLSLP